MIKDELGKDFTASIRCRESATSYVIHVAENATEYKCVLYSKSRIEYAVGEQVECWLYDCKNRFRELKFSDSNFGRLPVSDRMRSRFVSSLRDAIGIIQGEETRAESPSSLSEVKGMLNRCIRKDQWDWLSVYELFDRPSLDTMRTWVQYVVAKRRIITSIDRNGENMIEMSNSEAPLGMLDTLYGALSKLESSIKLDIKDSVSVRSRMLETHADKMQDQSVVITSYVTKAKYERANAEHSNALALLDSYLSKLGFVTQENKFIDLYTRLKSGPAIFEVKSITPANERSQCRKALSQLYEYRYIHSLADASLWLVLTNKPNSPWLLDYLSSDRQIGVIWFEGSMPAGPNSKMLEDIT